MEGIDDRALSYSMYAGQCINCQHWVGLEFPPNGVYFRCPAFPESIPLEVWDGTVRHDKILDGQEGDLTFKPKPMT